MQKRNIALQRRIIRTTMEQTLTPLAFRVAAVPPMAPKPTRQQMEDARGGKIPDRLAPQLKVLFVGINPSLYSAATGRHFARPGNRFWPALHDAGFTSRLFTPDEDHLLPDAGYGLTNVVARATARADELAAEEYVRGKRLLAGKVRRRDVGFVAFVGVTAYRIAMNQPKAQMGRQEEAFAGAVAWVLPNPSGLNAHYQREDFARLFGELKAASG